MFAPCNQSVILDIANKPQKFETQADFMNKFKKESDKKCHLAKQNYKINKESKPTIVQEDNVAKDCVAKYVNKTHSFNDIWTLIGDAHPYILDCEMSKKNKGTQSQNQTNETNENAEETFEVGGDIASLLTELGSNQNVNDYQDMTKATMTLYSDLDTLQKKENPESADLISRQIASMNNALASMHIENTLDQVSESATNYKTAKQLEQTGEHIGNVQQQILSRNKKILANLASDSMTAKRVATINQQHAIHAKVVTEYVQLCSIFLCVAILIMFVFSLAPVRAFFTHSFLIMQILLSILAGILLFIIVYRLIINRNHYAMLYQERVFPTYDSRVMQKKIPVDECPALKEEEDESNEIVEAPEPTCDDVEEVDPEYADGGYVEDEDPHFA